MRYRPRILVAEDDSASQGILIRRLTARGFRVAVVSDGTACLCRIGHEVPDLLLLDSELPGLDGLAVLGRLREHFTCHALPIILMFPANIENNIVRGLEAGANDCVTKPLDMPILLARIIASLRMKTGVGLLMEAERQRVLVETLKEACHRLSQPMTAATITLEDLIRNSVIEVRELKHELSDVLKWINEVSEVVHRLQRIGTPREVPYFERLEMFDDGAEVIPAV